MHKQLFKIIYTFVSISLGLITKLLQNHKDGKMHKTIVAVMFPVTSAPSLNYKIPYFTFTPTQCDHLHRSHGCPGRSLWSQSTQLHLSRGPKHGSPSSSTCMEGKGRGNHVRNNMWYFNQNYLVMLNSFTVAAHLCAAVLYQMYKKVISPHEYLWRLWQRHRPFLKSI